MTHAHVDCIWPAAARLGEGALWSAREQSLYWVDILSCRLMRYTPEGKIQRSWQFDEFICALGEREAGGLIVTLRSGFAFFDPDTGKLTRLHQPEPDRPGNRFNDGKVDALGRFWAGSMDFEKVVPSGALYCYAPDGECTRVEDGYVITNGPAWSADGRTMYHNDTAAGRVHAFDFDPRSGALSNRRLFLQLAPDEGYPDGMTPDAQGGLWLAHFAGGRVSRYLADGRLDRSLLLPTSNVTSCTFGGPGLCTLFITTATEELDDTQRAQQPLAGALFACEFSDGIHGLPAARFGQTPQQQ